MKILFVWTGVTSYMADCWRALAAEPGVELKVAIEPTGAGSELDAAAVLRGLDCELVATPEVFVSKGFDRFAPDVLFAVGWHSPVVRCAVARYTKVPKVCCFDMPWRNSLRCVAARFVLRRYLRQFAAAYVPGKLSAKYARWLGFSKVKMGLFSLDESRFAALPSPGDRRGFYYAGRLAPEKRLDIIERAYARYRELGGRWTFEIFGGRGFLQPHELAARIREKGCLLLASAFDPWPLVLLEAKSANCEAIVSDRCGNADELGAIKVPFGDVEAMAQAMLSVERGSQMVRPIELSNFDARTWASRTLRIAREVAGQ